MEEISDEVRRLVKEILVNGQDPGCRWWFMAGAAYMDQMTCVVLGLPSDDPIWRQVSGSLDLGTFYNPEIVARNILGWSASRDELADFIRENISATNSPSLLLHAHKLLQESACRRTAASRGDVAARPKSMIRGWLGWLK